ncbi:MAG: signal peptidase II [Thermomicrobiales bacterium]|nr:signal peptidase II [Thermomicrobiales bacterium]
MTMQETAAPKRPGQTQPESLLRLGFWMAVMVVALDQFAKYVIDLLIGPDRSRSTYWVIERHLGLDYVRNKGIAFGINLGNERLTTAIVGTAFIAVAVIFWKLAPKHTLTAVGAGLLVGGAIGNLIDRVRFNAVVDFIAVGPWPRFNFADAAIVFGVILLAWCASERFGYVTTDEEATKP